jgi:hypothetical protein
MRRAIQLIALIIGLASASIGVAANAEKVARSLAVNQSLTASAKLQGQGELTWLGLKIYDAQLWITTPASDANPPFNFRSQNFALELRYARALGGEAIATRSLGEIQKLGLGTAEQHEQWLGHMRKAFPDVKKNDRITGVFSAERGVSFYVNDQLRHRVDDLTFAQAFFAIWFDPKTSAPKLRAALLGQSAT